MGGKRIALRIGAALAVSGGALAIATPAFATGTSEQTLSGTVNPTITLTQTAPGGNFTSLTPGTDATAAEPTLKVAANTTYHLTVNATAWSASHLANPLQLATTAAQGAGDTNTAPSGSTATIPWGTATPVTLGSGTAEANTTDPATVQPDHFSGTITQPVSYADPPGTYKVTLTYTAATTV